MGYIHSIVYRPHNWPGARANDCFVRIPVAQACLLAGYGIEGDAKAGRHPRRQLNVLSHAWLEARRQEGYRVEPGAFGEQLVLAGVTLEEMSPGTLLRLGTEAEIEITYLRTGCAKVKLMHGGAQPGLEGAIGVLARVTHSGIIRVGDVVSYRQEKVPGRDAAPS